MTDTKFQNLVQGQGSITLSTKQFANAAEILFEGGRNGSSKEAILGAIVEETGVPLLGTGQGQGI